MKLSALLLTSISLLVLTSCSNDMDEEFSRNGELPVPLRIAISEMNPHTRAIVNGIGDITASNLGIYEVAESTTTGIFPWTSSPLLSNSAPSAINGNQLTFSPRLYYPIGGKRVIFYGYYPRTTSATGNTYITPPGNGTAPTYTFSFSGQEDIMFAVSPPSGSYSGGTISLTFNHKMTQIQLNTTALGALLTTIKILSIPNSGTMNLETGVITYASTTSDLTFSKASLTTTNPLLVPANVASYMLEASIVGIGLRRYLIKPTSGNFLPGVVYTISI